MRRDMFIICLAVILMIFIPAAVLAQAGGNITWGKLSVIPSASLQFMYDDNIFLKNGTDDGNNEEVSDYITHFRPGLFVNYSLDGRGRVSAGYLGDWAWYGQNQVNDWNSQSALFALDYNAPAGLMVGITNRYTNTGDPYGSENEFALGEPQTKRWFDNLQSKFGWDFSARFQTFLYYNFYKQSFDDIADFTQDWKSNEFGAGGQIRVMPKTWAFFRFHYGERDYFTHPGPPSLLTGSNDADFDYQRVSTGLTWGSGTKFSGELNFGYQWQSYGNPLDPTGAAYEDRNTLVAKTAVTWDATATTSLSGTILRAIRLTGGNSSQQYVDTSVSIGLKQKLLAKLNLRARGRYAFHDYNLPATGTRKDNNYGASLGLDYDIRDWLQASCDYTYSRKDSNVVINDYTDNQVMVMLRAVY